MHQLEQATTNGQAGIEIRRFGELTLGLRAATVLTYSGDKINLQ